MCLAIHKPKGFVVPKDYLRAGFYSNCSGSGFMYHDNGKLNVVKGLFSFREFYEQVETAGQENHDMSFHFRAATHGPVSDENCHPYAMCDGKFAMLHNGIFRVPMKLQNLSDSGNFAHFILEPAIKNGSYKDIKKIHDHPLWGWGAVVLMSANGEVIIYNEEMGGWDDGVWYSNGAYKYGSYVPSKYFEERDSADYRPSPRPGYSCYECD